MMWYVGDSIKYVINNLLYTKKLEAEEYGSKGPAEAVREAGRESDHPRDFGKNIEKYE